MNEVTDIIPFSAWQQAVFVVLLIVLVIWMLTWMSKWHKTWQEFIAERDDKWQSFSREQQKENKASMCDVNKSLSDLIQVSGKLVQTVDEMRQDIYRHDDHAKEASREILRVVSAPKPAPRPRKT